ncbi:hypothetical protein [Shewanella salipaludis]|uniref:Uncharacterized protein n=1 Tax=Shewanella salipaludis TaxID=2723052 RepID=A0A972JK05_9GAMM|nr:hypothetical protein [Shewanella salipaludis]NMH65705.1 hypothetical protein [Shewanella salipaludis]
MSLLIFLFGVLIALAGAWLLLRPESLFGLLIRHGRSFGLYLFAILIRLLLGAVLIQGAPDSRFPLLLLILGAISLVAASALAFMGQTRFHKLLEWAVKLAPDYRVVAGMLVLLFGVFLMYAVY